MSNYNDLFNDLRPHGTVRFTLQGVNVRSQRPLVLIMQHAGESNPAFMNARRKAENQLRATAGDPTNEQTREALIPVFAETVIVGWEEVIGKDGQPIAFSPHEVESLLSVLNRKGAGDLIARAFNYALDADHFRAPLGTVEALGNG
jgi:hypothetical protein